MSVSFDPIGPLRRRRSSSTGTVDAIVDKDNESVFDSSLIGHIASGTGAVERTAQSKMREIVSAADFGAVPGASRSVTRAGILAAAASLDAIQGGIVWLGSGTLQIDGTITDAGTRVVYQGNGAVSTIINSNANTSPIFEFTTFRCGLKDLALQYTAPASGATAIRLNGSSDFKFSGIYILNCDIGIDASGLSIVRGSQFSIDSYLTSGIRARDNTLEFHINQFVINAGAATGTSGGITLRNFVDAFMAADGDILNGAKSIDVSAASYAASARPGNSNFTSVYFDSATTYGADIQQMTNTEFIGCWFSGGRSGGGFPGLRLSQSDAVQFIGCRFFNCGNSGASVESNANAALFQGCTFEANGQTSAAAGLTVIEATNIRLLGNTAKVGTYGTPNQPYGFSLNGACTGIAQGNILSGSTGPLFPGMTGHGFRIIDNPGYNPVGSTSITVGASPYTYTASPCPETVYVSGGTVSQISHNSTATGLTAGTFQLGPNENIVVTYTVLPTMRKMVH
ncbi:MAG: right-handed parallel beta-helix repeat-containing protein [Pseudohongiellaceae bacterium]